MSTPLVRLTQNYTPAFLAFANNPDEQHLHRAYELGRTPLADGITLLDIIRTHHAAVVHLANTLNAEAQTDAHHDAAAFLTEALAPFEMARLGYLEQARENQPHA